MAQSVKAPTYFGSGSYEASQVRGRSRTDTFTSTVYLLRYNLALILSIGSPLLGPEPMETGRKCKTRSKATHLPFAERNKINVYHLLWKFVSTSEYNSNILIQFDTNTICNNKSPNGYIRIKSTKLLKATLLLSFKRMLSLNNEFSDKYSLV